VKNLIQFNRALLGVSSCGGMLQRGRLYGDQWWTLNMIVWRRGWCFKEVSGSVEKYKEEVGRFF
jgi:hypothetical protein